MVQTLASKLAAASNFCCKFLKKPIWFLISGCLSSWGQCKGDISRAFPLRFAACSTNLQRLTHKSVYTSNCSDKFQRKKFGFSSVAVYQAGVRAQARAFPLRFTACSTNLQPLIQSQASCKIAFLTKLISLGLICDCSFSLCQSI